MSQTKKDIEMRNSKTLLTLMRIEGHKEQIRKAQNEVNHTLNIFKILYLVYKVHKMVRKFNREMKEYDHDWRKL